MCRFGVVLLICFAAAAVAGDSKHRTSNNLASAPTRQSNVSSAPSSLSALQQNTPCIPLSSAYKCPAWVATFNGVGDNGDTPGDNYLNSHVVATSPDGRTFFIGGGTTNKATGVDFLALAFDVESGALRWSFEFPGMPAGYFALAYAIAVSPNNDRVYLTGTSDITGLTTIALSAQTGEILWIANHRVFDGPNDIALSADGSRVFISGLGGFGGGAEGSGHVKAIIECYDAATGARLWTQHDTGNPGADDIAYDIVASRTTNRVYMAAGILNEQGYTTDLLLFVYDGDGNLINETHHPTYGLLPAGLAITPDDSRVFMVETNLDPVNNTLTVAYDANGDEVWSAQSFGVCTDTQFCSSQPWYFAPVTSSPDSKTAYVAMRFRGQTDTTGFALNAYDAATGSQKWIGHYDADLGTSGGGVVVANPNGNEVYLAGAAISGALTLAFDAATGAQNWASLYPRGGANGIAVTPDGSKVVTVGNVPGYLVHPPSTGNPTDPADVFAVAFDTATAPTPPSSLQLVDLVSRKTHGDAGTFDVHFAQPGRIGVEPRSGGTNDEHAIIFTFSSPLLAVGGASVDCGTIATSSLGPGANQYTVNLTGAGTCDGKYVSITLQDVIATDGTASLSVLSPPIGLLLGDTTGDRVVNSTDITQTKASSGANLGESSFRTDVNTDGFLNSTDIAFVKSRSGTALP
jgi:hypothetical protein